MHEMDSRCGQFFRKYPQLSVVINITSDTPFLTVVQWLASHSSITDFTDELSRSLAVTSAPIARGGLSDVYRATRSDGTQLAIKCLRRHDPKHVKRTARELNTWSRLKHQNVLELSGLALFQGCLAMVSPWMKYGSVTSVVKQWPDRDRYKLCQQLTAAIDNLHREGVVHGDIKGENALVAKDGTLKLTDFGLAVMHDVAVEFSQTDPGGGTARYMAPELWEEDSERSREADVYAMGMTMLEILTGDVPFPEIKSAHRIGIAVAQQRRVPDVPELQKESASLEEKVMLAVLRSCWKYEPKDRPTARKVALLVRGVVDN
ncbi:hypothetical protein FRC12_003175 [Ceratobasidium sp. 428]|nr:hypothetical protein FRC12_003175 [Ceratobasidium sp. 428]